MPAERVITDPGASTPTNRACGQADLRLSQLIMAPELPSARAVATCRALGIDAIGVGDDSARHTECHGGEDYSRSAGMRKDHRRSATRLDTRSRRAQLPPTSPGAIQAQS